MDLIGRADRVQRAAALSAAARHAAAEKTLHGAGAGGEKHAARKAALREADRAPAGGRADPVVSLPGRVVAPADAGGELGTYLIYQSRGIYITLNLADGNRRRLFGWKF